MRVLLALAMLLALGMLNPAPVGAVTTWRVAVLVYDSVDVTCAGRLVRSSLHEGETDVQEALTDLETARARIEAAGDGAISFTIIRAGTLTSVAPLGTDSCWPAPENVAMPTGYDSVYVLYENDVEGGASLNGYGGLSFASCCFSGGTYAAQPIWDGHQDWFDTGYNVGIFVHEWGNGVGGFYRSKFGETQVPSLYTDQSRYTFTDWYMDWYGGRLFDTQTGDYVGLEPHVWASGTPTGTASPPSPSPSPSPSASDDPASKVCRNPTSNAKACR